MIRVLLALVALALAACGGQDLGCPTSLPLQCTPTKCCARTMPYFCATTGSCYPDALTAEQDCGSAYAVCR